jgi:superfamily II DNA or RNA helicase
MYGITKYSILNIRNEKILWQFYDLFESIFPGEVGIIGDGKCEIKRINICSIWSVSLAFGMRNTFSEDDTIKEKKISEKYYDNIKNMVINADLNVMDEVHYGSSKTFQVIGKYFNSEFTLGFSATPWREDNSDLLIESIFSKIIINISASELIEKGYLVQPIIKFINVPKVRYPLAMTYRDIYREYVTNNVDRNNLIIRGAISLIEQNFITMVLFREIQHGNLLYQELIKKGIYCNLLSGKDSTDERQRAIDEVTSGKCKLLLSSSIFETGVDLPCLSGLIMGSPSKSSTRTMQKTGRVIRTSPHKDFAAIIDFYDRCRYLKEHSLIRQRIYESEKGFIVKPTKEMFQ